MKINRKHIQNSFVNILGFLFHFIFFLVRFCSVNWARFSIHTILSSILTNCWRVLYIYIQQPEHHSFHQDATDENPIFARTMFGLSVIWELCSARSQTFNRSNALQLLFLLRKCIELEINSKVCVRVCMSVYRSYRYACKFRNIQTESSFAQLSLIVRNKWTRKKNITHKNSSVWVCVW